MPDSTVRHRAPCLLCRRQTWPNGLAKTAAIEYSKQAIRINSVHPGDIDTPLLDALDRDACSHLKALHPIGRLGAAADVAQVVAFLLAEEAPPLSRAASILRTAPIRPLTSRLRIRGKGECDGCRPLVLEYREIPGQYPRLSERP